MIRNSRQDWSAGSTVKVGFLTLKVVRAIPTPGDCRPDKYELINLDGSRRYEFTPHLGLERI